MSTDDVDPELRANVEKASPMKRKGVVTLGRIIWGTLYVAGAASSLLVIVCWCIGISRAGW